MLSSHGIIHPLLNWCITTTTAGSSNFILTSFLSPYLALRVDCNTDEHAASKSVNIVLIN